MPNYFKRKKITFKDEDINISDRKKTNNNNPLTRIVKLIIWVLIIFLIIFYINYSSFKKDVLIKNETIIKIETNDTFYNLWNKIQELDNKYYKIYIKNNIPNYSLKEWSYRINSDSNIQDIINSLEKPILEQINVTILEWWNIFDIDEYLSKKWLIKDWEYISYVENPEKIKQLWEFYKFIKDQKTLEGFLYPDTYSVNTNFKINNFVIQQLDTFEKKVYNKILTNIDYKTINDLVNLASIVEKEEKNPSEKATVAWILKKRLNSWWMIGADITVCYPYRLTSEECKMVVTKYINKKNSYNTRTKVWLPKTPISNPNYETIFATLNDKKTKYWFYLHNISTWKIYYAETNSEHESNKAYMN